MLIALPFTMALIVAELLLAPVGADRLTDENWDVSGAFTAIVLLVTEMLLNALMAPPIVADPLVPKLDSETLPNCELMD
jgi:hypothetical protein